MGPIVKSPPAMLIDVTILQGTAQGIRKAAKDAEGEAKKTARSKREAERELAIARQLIVSCQKLTKEVVSLWQGIRGFLKAGELGEKDLLTAERILKRIFASGESSFATVRGFLRFLQSHSLNPPGIGEFEAAASRLAAAREDFTESYADLRDPRLQDSIRKAMRATGEPWDWQKELFGDQVPRTHRRAPANFGEQREPGRYSPYSPMIFTSTRLGLLPSNSP
jgi:hypothetical protein